MRGKSAGLSFGKSTVGAQGYMEPRPVSGHGPHRYRFYVLALRRRAEVPPALALDRFLERIAGNVIAYGCLVGTYERPDADQ